MFTTIVNCLHWPQNLIAAIGLKNGYTKVCDLNDDQMDGLTYVLDQLTERERVIIYYRYMEEMNLKQIANTMKISVTRTQQLIAKSIEKLSQPFYVDYYLHGLQATQIMKSKQKEEIRNTDNLDAQITLLKKILLNNIEISERTRRGLLKARMESLGDVAELLYSNPDSLIRLREIGIKSVIEIIEILEEYGVDCDDARHIYSS